MQLRCTECGKYKPEEQVQFGVCDDCYRHGSARSAPPPPEQSEFEKQRLAAIRASRVVLSTSIDVPGREIDHVIDVVGAEVAIAQNIFKDILNSARDLIGGRSGIIEKTLKQARVDCLAQLRVEATNIDADAVVAVAFNYNQAATGNAGGILFVVATGTAVKFAI
ncbi:YbjQ family protein [Rhizobium ruizarguesonis]